MMAKDPLIYIDHVLESIALIQTYIANGNQETLKKNRMLYDAVLRNLQTLSESIQKIPEELKQHYPEIAWKDIAGFRNILVHDYLEGVDYEIIWSVTQIELPKLQKVIENMKADLPLNS